MTEIGRIERDYGFGFWKRNRKGDMG